MNIFDPNPPSVFLVKQQSPGLGGERDVLIDVIGTSSPFSVAALIGNDRTGGRGMLEIATAGTSATRVALQYDGDKNDDLDSVDTGLHNAKGLSVDLTDGGTNDRFELKFAFTDGVDPRGLDVGIVAYSPTGGSLTYWGYVPNSSNASTSSIAFSEFKEQGEASFGEIDSLLFFFNFEGTPNVDFALDSIEAVPEPSTFALLGLGILVFAAYGLRRRKR